MRVLLLTMGTRGDVEPFLAFAAAGPTSGHDVLLAAPQRFAGAVARASVPFAGLDDGPLRLLDGDGGIAELGGRGLRGRVALMRRLPELFERFLDGCTAVVGPDGFRPDVVVHNGQAIAGPHLAEMLEVPAVLALPLPMYVPTSEFAWPGLPVGRTLPGPVNRMTYLGMRAPALAFAGTVDRWRRELGLPRRRGRHDPLHDAAGREVTVLHAMSRYVVPPPRDWPCSAVVTGLWTCEHGPDPLAPGLRDFLDAGEPPVYAGFGSMTSADPRRATEAVLGAVRAVGARLVLATGSGGLAAPDVDDDRVHVVTEAPHGALFPRVRAVIHHGGAGTTGAAVRAGVPQVVCPFVADQPFWAERVRRLGVAARAVPQRRLTVDRLAGALDEVLGDPGIGPRARALAEQVRTEHGVEVAMRRVEDTVDAAG